MDFLWKTDEMDETKVNDHLRMPAVVDTSKIIIIRQWLRQTTTHNTITIHCYMQSLARILVLIHAYKALSSLRHGRWISVWRWRRQKMMQRRKSRKSSSFNLFNVTCASNYSPSCCYCRCRCCSHRRCFTTPTSRLSIIWNICLSQQCKAPFTESKTMNVAAVSTLT